MTTSQKRIQLAAIKLFAERDLTTVPVSDLAQAAGVARGTIYNNFKSLDNLFEDVATQIAQEMQERINASFVGKEDPAHRIANGIRLYVKRAHEEPQWGRFVIRFSLSISTVRVLGEGRFVGDLTRGLADGRFQFSPDQLGAVVMMVTGTVLANMYQVLEGLYTWRKAGTDAAELVLRALGVSAEDAIALSTIELPQLARPN